MIPVKNGESTSVGGSDPLATRRSGGSKPQPQPPAALRHHRHRQEKVRRSRNGNRPPSDIVDENSTMYSPRVPTAPTRRRPSQLPPPSVGAATDGFDAVTTEAQTDWNTTGIEGEEGRDYSVSVSGYRNYVNEMERMLGGEVDVHLDVPPPASARIGGENSRRKDREVRYPPPPESVHGTDVGAGGRRPALSSYGSIDNVRHVTGRRGRVELVEHKIMEDGPERTISLWRERVAQSGDGTSRYGDESSKTESMYSPGHRRVLSADSYHERREEVRYPTGRGSVQPTSTQLAPSKGKSVSRESNGGYERTEYMVSYHKPFRSGSEMPRYLYPLMEVESASGVATAGHRRTNSATTRPTTYGLTSIVTNTQPSSPTTRRTSGRTSYERTEAANNSPISTMRSGGGGGSGSGGSGGRAQCHHMAERVDTSSVLKATTTSPVELVLATCEPSLLHIASILTDLGIVKLEHLRAMGRMSEETRDRELKSIALLRGVTVMEWAILLDKLQTL